MTTGYLPLTEYSSKYKVSISTLRRRIKADDIQFVFEDGKYFLHDSPAVGPASTHQRIHRPSPGNSERKNAASNTAAFSEALMSAPQHFYGSHAGDRAVGNAGVVSEAAPFFSFQSRSEAPTFAVEVAPAPTPTAAAGEEPVLAAANRLLTELKKAYSQILHDKEEQVLHLREELADLKTLVRVLESENDRLSRRLK
jgi:hypothetical protein